jgi:hypothetical protein
MHPVQTQNVGRRRNEGRSQITSLVTLRAYEVYREVHGEQKALIDLAGRDCRGGFGVGELIAFLYARSFPKSEWRARVDEAFKGMKL